MSARWTPARIRKATPFPKPQGAIAAAMGDVADSATSLGLQLKLLRHIAAHGDLIDQPVVEPGSIFESPVKMRGQWLLVPLSLDMLDALAEFEAHLADLESDLDDYEPDVDREQDDADAEPNLGQPEGRLGLWADHGAMDREEDHLEDEIETDGHDLPYERARGLKLL
jgi:hypothetical protein